MSKDPQEKLDDILNELVVSTNHLIFTCQALMRMIERATKYDPPSNKYQLEFLEQIDKQLAQGQSEASFWKDKLVLQSTEE